MAEKSKADQLALRCTSPRICRRGFETQICDEITFF
ncbi:hypothetical protein SLEP1_g40872 [Rubroshorea leprosula]|uniref:Uncharacterized protein n=1 Tax=Rubroshorea leprosula TaxID=152421 RepID=A0AAV5L549_9ROSI|nr:hypothetical protein SLEP1_g40872 [Rubroshorea leprosula]